MYRGVRDFDARALNIQPAFELTATKLHIEKLQFDAYVNRSSYRGYNRHHGSVTETDRVSRERE